MNAGYFRVLASFNSSEFPKIGWNEWLSAMFSGQFFSGPEGSNIGFQKAVLEPCSIPKGSRVLDRTLVLCFVFWALWATKFTVCCFDQKNNVHPGWLHLRNFCLNITRPAKVIHEKILLIPSNCVFVTNAKKLAFWKRQMFKLPINFSSTMHFTHVDFRFDYPFHFEKVALFIWLRSITWGYFKCRQRLTSLVGMGKSWRAIK